MAVRVARARAIGQNMTGHGSHDSAGQSSLKQTRVEQSKEEQHRAYITILHIDRPSPALVLSPVLPCRAVPCYPAPCHTLPCHVLVCPAVASLSCAALLCIALLLYLRCRVYIVYINVAPFIDPVSCKLILVY
jgi:hypothetical protein